MCNRDKYTEHRDAIIETEFHPPSCGKTEYTEFSKSVPPLIFVCSEPCDECAHELELNDNDYVFSDSSMHAQSGVVLDDHEAKQTEEHQELVTYLDENLGETVGMSAMREAMVAPDFVETAMLANFLKRPVNIATLTWNESTAAGGLQQTYYPWHLFFNNTNIKYKLNNYAFIKCNLKIKIVINASPFYYGAMNMSYLPLDGIYQNNVLNTNTSIFPHLMALTQRPHLWIYPQNSEGGEMTLPFFYTKDWLSIGVANDFSTMGSILFVNATQLKSANDVVGQGVTIQIYAWAEDVQISGPTTALSMQAGEVADEYGQGVVSKPASAIASVASKLTSIPYIGPFARATEIGMRAVGAIASLFGFSNPPVIENVRPYRPSPFPHLASPEISYPVEKLTLDPKNELTVDPRNVGLPGTDELDISSIVTRECLLTGFAWTDSDSVGDLKFSARVIPRYFWATTTPTPSVQELQFSSMGFVNQMFQFWRGDIIFRFRVICSQYHKGRIRLSWDPYGTGSQTTSDTTHLIQTVIMDIGKDSDVEMRIPYHQALPWLTSNVNLAQASMDFQTSTFNLTLDQTQHNGLITARILTELTGPTATPNIDILVFVRAAENLEFAGPRAASGPDAGVHYSLWPPQAGVVDDMTQRSTSVVAGSTYQDKPSRFLENMGERVTNLRVLLHRMCQHSHWVTYSTSTLPYITARSVLSAFPYYFGYCNQFKLGNGGQYGIDAARSIVNTGSVTPISYNFSYTTYLNWIAPAFVGWRGAINWTINHNSGGKNVSCIRASRETNYSSPAGQSSAANTFSRDSNAAKNAFNAANSGAAGASLTSQSTLSGLNVSIPFYNSRKFLPVNPAETMVASAVNGSNFCWWSNEIDWCGEQGIANQPGGSWRVDRYVAAGSDFTLLFYLNPPTRWVMPVPADF